MTSFTYGFINAKVGAMKSYLLDGVEIKSLIESRDFDDAVALLKNTAYAKEFAKLSSPSVVEIENVFSKTMFNDSEKLVKSIGGIPKIFLAHYAKKFEIDLLKLLLVMKSKGEDLEEYAWIAQRMATVPMAEKLGDVETVGELVEMLRFTKYYPILHKAVSEYEELGTVYPFITALDGYYYSGLDEIIQNDVVRQRMSGRDRGIAERLMGIEIDAKNLLTVLRIRGTDEKDALNWLMPIRYKLTDSELKAAFSIEKITELPQVLTHYTGIVSAGVKEYEKTQSLFALENEFKKFILKANNRLFCGDRFHIGIPLAYMNLKENEIRNLTAILHGKEEGLDSSKIEETVILST